MKKLLGIILAVAMLATVFATISLSGTVSATAATNLLVGTIGTFEDNVVPTGWDKLGPALAVTTTQKHGGTTSIMQTGRGTDSWDTPAYNIYSLLKANGAGTYVASMWVRASAAAALPRVVIRVATAGQYSFVPAALDHAPLNAGTATAADTWTYYTGSVTVTQTDLDSASGEMNLCIDSLTADTIYMDDVQLYKVPTDDIYNGTFEEPFNAEGWTYFNDAAVTSSISAVAHTGSAALSFTTPSQYASISTNVNTILASNGAGYYTLHYWAKLDAAATATDTLTPYLTTSTNKHFNFGSVLTINKDTWSESTATIHVTATSAVTLADMTSATTFLRWQRAGAGAAAPACLIDDVSITYSATDPSITASPAPTAVPTAGPTAAPVTQLTCDFEDGTAQGWIAGLGAPTFVASAEAAHGGTKSLKVTGRGDTYHGPALDISTILANGAGEYKITAFIKRIGSVGDAAEPAVRMLLRDKTSLGSYLTAEGATSTVAMTNTTNDWVELTIDYTFTDADLKYNLLCFDSLKFDFYLDDVSVEKVIAAPDATATAKPEVKAFQYTVEGTADSDTNGACLFCSGMVGHYDAATDTATLYVMNTSDKALTFQLCVGWHWDKDGDNMSSAEGEPVEVAAGAVAKITATNVSDYFTKTGEDPFYDATKPLDGTSVVRLIVTGTEAGDTFLLAGITSVGAVKGNGNQGDMSANFTEMIAPTALANLVLGITGEEGTADAATLGYAIAAISALGALAVGKRRFKK